jgi:hypothetical protein
MSGEGKVLIDGVQTTLAELAGIDMEGIAEKRGESLPKGFYVFETLAGDDTPHLGIKGEGEKAKAAAIFKFKVLDVLTVNDPEYIGNKDDLIGKTHSESLFITDADGLGYAKAFIADIGGKGFTGDLKSRLAQCAGLRFEAPIGKRKDKNDTDIVYTNIVRGNKVKPLAAAPASAVANQVAA